MFTGIVEEVGEVVAVASGGEARRISICAPLVAAELEVGASVAVDGACLTAIGVDADGFEVEAVGSTLERTVAGTYAPGSRVNLERALRMGERLDGHLVQGHVDGVGCVVSVREEADSRLMDFRVPLGVARETIQHGSITINGVSLTVNALPEPDIVQVAIIPFTWSHTTFHALEPADPVNVEGDLIGKYVGKLLSVRSTDSPRG